jgi:hypothetical protein
MQSTHLHFLQAAAGGEEITECFEFEMLPRTQLQAAEAGEAGSCGAQERCECVRSNLQLRDPLQQPKVLTKRHWIAVNNNQQLIQAWQPSGQRCQRAYCPATEGQPLQG